MQDGYIFSESIAKNITTSDTHIDTARLQQATETACIHQFITEMPLGYNTVIGQEGQGLSQGQRQRILIARAVYKILIFYSWMKPPMRWMPPMKRLYRRICKSFTEEKQW